MNTAITPTDSQRALLEAAARSEPGAIALEKPRQPGLAGLVKAGLMIIVPAKDGPDRRTVQLRLLPAGAKLLRGMPGPAAGVLPAALEALDGETLLRLRDDLARLVALLGADERGASIPLSDL